MPVLRRLPIYLLCIALLAAPLPGWSADKDEEDKKDNPLAGLPLRHIGPAITSGRISHFAFHPERKQEFYVATASGNLWKTANNTISWQPIFDGEASYSIGHIALDPQNPLTLWVGTGENNAQRSVAYGDGVYKSVDGGETWNNVGLKDSGHISQIWIHPKDSNNVLVAAQGPLWIDGGDRGLYRTTDGGKTWEKILEIDKYPGVNEFVVDPRNPDRIVASSYQRRRHVWTLINGGPGSAIHKTVDGGKTWTKIAAGLPKDHMGRIGLAGAPTAPDTIYAIAEANDEEQGVYRSTDFGDNWHKRSGYMSGSPQYYNELVVDPKNPDRVYALNTFCMISEDAGKTFSPLSITFRHVDDHALWIDPDQTEHLYIGGDGGIYETWDRGQTWRHVRNLSITQFYRIQPDNELPFYNVCGGTQDNNSLCAPSRTPVIHGITNSDWTIVLGGDGYKPQIDPTDPDTIYAQYQYGGLARYDRRTQEYLYVMPHPESGENEYKWNWNTPLLISPHNPRRLFYASEFVFQSDDRGDTWRKISPDLTRKLDRNRLKVMDRIWGVDAIAKNDSTSKYGSIIGISESPLQEGLIFVGTDDGQISVTENGGANWSTVSRFPGVPDQAYVDDVVASQHSADVAYAVLDQHKLGDYKPYVIRTTNRGTSWRLISGDLPQRGSAHTLAEDHVQPDLLFVGTEFGLFFTQDGGTGWTQLKSDFPTIAVRDLEIQRRENDLVVGTFGRGIYILDDYSALRVPAKQIEQAEASLFPVKDAWLYIEGSLWDGREKGSMGSEFFTASNPPFGAVFTYQIKDDLRTQQKDRRKREIEVEQQGGDTPYPSWDELRNEDREDPPQLIFIVSDLQGNVVRRVAGETKKGLHRTAWDLRLAPPDPVELSKPEFQPYWVTPPQGPLALPGDYTVTMVKRQAGEIRQLGTPQRFTVKPLDNSPEITRDRRSLQAFHRKAAELQRAVLGATESTSEIETRIDHLKEALRLTPSATVEHDRSLQTIESGLDDLNLKLHGDQTLSSRNEPAPWSISTRIASIYQGNLASQSSIPASYLASYEIAAGEFAAALAELTRLEQTLSEFEVELERLGAPWTPGRTPVWRTDPSD